VITTPLLSNVRHRPMITPVSPLLTSSFILTRVTGQLFVRLKLFSKWKLSIWLDFKCNVLYKSIASKNIKSDMNYVLKNICLQKAAQLWQMILSKARVKGVERTPQKSC